ncbi:MAG: SPOR domain-containing protein [Bacteroidales bacterium]|nr:MAG: SPOR domain-containing protein [Bacteroidales bacterium]
MNSKELAELICQNTRIILPEFGAFLVKDSGEKGFNPLNVSFSPFLRYNDGMLEVNVAKKRGISKEEAAKDVHAFVETIKNELLEKGFFEVEGLGELKRDQRGGLSFSLLRPEEQQKNLEKGTDKSNSAKKELPPIAAQTIDKSDVLRIEEKTAEESATIKKPKKITDEKAKVEKLTTTKKVKKIPVEVKTSQPELIKDIISESTLEIESERNIETLQSIQVSTNEIQVESKLSEKDTITHTDDKSSPTLEIEDKPSDVNEPSKKNRFSGLLYSIIAIGIIIILFFVIRNYYFSPNIEGVNDITSVKAEQKSTANDKVEANGKVEKPNDEIDKAFNEESKEGNPSKEQLRKEKELEDAIANNLIKDSQTKINKKSINTGIRYYIIAGSFKNPDFAANYMNELKQSGYNAAIVVQPSGMNAVNIGSYTSREEANSALKGFKSKLPNLWILKK